MRVRVASAGTGKTTSLVIRYLELLDSGVPLRRIAGITYTRTAAGELRQRVREGIGELLDTGSYLGVRHLDPERRPIFEAALRELGGASLDTIHGFMIEALRLVAPVMGLDPEFSLLPEWEAEALFEEELRSLLFLAAAAEHPLHADVRRLGRRAAELPRELFERRSLVESFTADDDPHSGAVVRLYEQARERFERRLGGRSLAPSEVEGRALGLASIPAALVRVVSRYRLALVDEFQDVNPLQGRFFEALEQAGVAVEVVGDPKQSIYGFRNADVGVFRRARQVGEELEPLTVSYRHGGVVNRFLNRLTATLAATRRGFDESEAPHVNAAGGDAEAGRVEVHWVVGDEPVAHLREVEAGVLAARLAALHSEQGVEYAEMAVLARAHASLAVVEKALRQLGVPALLLRGRGLYERIEIRDLHNAISAAVEPAGLPFTAYLRGPFGGLDPAAVERVMAAADPVQALGEVEPEAARRFAEVRTLLDLEPLEILKRLARERLIAGRSYLELLAPGQRDNVDALLLDVARHPPADLRELLELLQRLVRQRDAGDVPQEGAGVALLTVHAAKGLEWRAAALFDLGRGPDRRPPPLVVHPATGRASLRSSPGYAEALADRREREEQESYRLLYVAASRPREFLLLSGSARAGKPVGWATALQEMDLGPGARQWDRPELLLRVHRPADWPSDGPPAMTRAAPRPAQGRLAPGSAGGVGARRGLAQAEWTARIFPPHPGPPLLGPSRLSAEPAAASLGLAVEAALSPHDGAAPSPHDEDALSPPDGAAPSPHDEDALSPHEEDAPALHHEDDEPLRPGGIGESAPLPGRGKAVGTLVHYAISQDWDPRDPAHLANLEAQEVMFPFDDDERRSVVAEVAELLGTYRAMLGCELPPLEDRSADEAELPMALPVGASVLQGVIDRLYQVAGRWYLDDYKTDRVIRPERYLPQLAAYAEAVRRARRVEPIVRLVYLRDRQVVAVGQGELAAAWRAAAAGVAGEGAPP